ncbi:MAG: RNA-directed DNA polymerase [Lachnospiraceae bacterium]|nr:RNA-directed DNA polymerase [Lachnospiraceae bacterium]
MLKIENLLLNEYFPAELPRCFSTKQVFGKIDRIKGWTTSATSAASNPLVYSGFKNEFARRKFAVPNFYHYYKAAECIAENSEKILDITTKSKHSLTSPQRGNVDTSLPYNKKSYSRNQTRNYVENMYQDNMYQIRLDINNFFDSIYTHSIPWAIHTKQVAKRKQNDKSLLGNKLDMFIRAMNGNQTNGVLIGNALSRIISEIILCTIDNDIDKEYKDLQYIRFVDDYYIFVHEATLIQEIVAFIRKKLSEYELILNESKIQVLESPFTFDKPWIEELKLFSFNSEELLLNKAIILYNEYKDISILKFALKIISFNDITITDWNRVESKLYNLWVRFPVLSDLIIELLMQKKEIIHKQKLKKAIYTNLDKCMLLNWQQELVWILWAIKVFEIRIKQDYVLEILKSNNDLAIIIVLDCIDAGIIDCTASVTKQIDALRQELNDLDIDENGKNGNLMWSSRWLLAYECQLHKWINTENGSFYTVDNNAFYKSLLKSKVDFYDAGVLPDVNDNISKRSKTQRIMDYIKCINAQENDDKNETELLEIQKSARNYIFNVIYSDEY